MKKNRVVIGTRGSLLAVAQTKDVRAMLQEKYPEIEFELKEIVTTGDTDLRTNWNNSDTSLKSLFTKEIEKELLDGTIQLAVHSMKDMPADSPEGLICGAIPAREDYRDVMVSKTGTKLSELPEGAVVGTSSLRRTMAIKEMRPDLVIEPIRGNIHTRLRKLREENFDAIVLAAAGLKRVGLESEITQYLETHEMMPAPAQGALCIQCKEDDTFTREILSSITDREVEEVVEIEREFSRIFDGGCHTPMGCSGEITGDEICLKGMYCHEGVIYKGQLTGKREEGKALAQKLAGIIRGQIDGQR
ncbi:hydroxymethylbilane synthase [Ilyobacter sp.]|uniref:hydroxymethylbilane synthase n=1 Tax=Ilyobacter sp. TaxID=3100343 RepID=UPI0035614290